MESRRGTGYGLGGPWTSPENLTLTERPATEAALWDPVHTKGPDPADPETESRSGVVQEGTYCSRGFFLGGEECSKIRGW